MTTPDAPAPNTDPVPFDSFDAHILTSEGLHHGQDHILLASGSLDEDATFVRITDPCIVIVASETVLDELGDPTARQTEYVRYSLEPGDTLLAALNALVTNGWNPDGCIVQPMWKDIGAGYLLIQNVKHGRPDGDVNVHSKGF